MARDTVVLADLALEAAIAELASTTCAVSYSTDTWTGPNGKAYMVLTGHFVSVQWELRQVILAFVEMPGRHGGNEIAKAVEKVVVQWKLQTCCLGLTTDNASANVVALRHLAEEGEFSGYFSEKAHYRVSTAAEGSTYPTVSMVLPYFYALIDSLEKKLHTGTHELVRPLMSAALGHLKQYEFAIGDEYWIATFLDPSMKAKYFRMTHWELMHPGIVARDGGRLKPRMSADRVVSLVRRRVEEYQARAAREAPTPPPAPAAAVVTPFEDDDDEFVFSRAQLQKRVSASAAARAGGGGTSVGDEVDRYLAELPVSDVPALQYWQRARNMDTLRQMARDYLAIPATSAASERAFSMGRNLISLHRHRLNTERVSASMTLRSWYTSHPGKSIGEEPGRSGQQAPPELALEGEGLDEGDEEEAVAVGGGTGVE
ncbi:unnamed protein product [Closterium sp. Naga37s-1]|nr:unnamed protein product [Closterium sp. Naga37s-1]